MGLFSNSKKIKFDGKKYTIKLPCLGATFLWEDEFDKFPRAPKLNVKYAGMMQYDGDALIPQKYLVNPPGIDRTVGEYLVKAGIKQLAISETQKFGHVTYFFNGNRSGKFDDSLEDYIEVPSDIVPFEERPWMKAAEITDKVVEAILGGEYDFIRLNYANGDMVGHTGIHGIQVRNDRAFALHGITV